MRILHVIAELGLGGAERMVIQLATDAVSGGNPVAVAAATGVWVGELEANGGTYFETDLAKRRPVEATRSAARLADIVAAFEPDIVHTHNVGVTTTVRFGLVLDAARRMLARRAASRPPVLVTTVHGLAPEDYRPAARLLRVVGGPLVACAPAVRAHLIKAGLPAGRVTVITNGAKLAPASPASVRAAQARFGLDGRPLVVGLGRLVEQKSWPTLIAASRYLDGIDVVVGGYGALEASLRAQAEEAGGRVRFVGLVDDVAALLGSATCAVSTSLWEGLPLTLLEMLSLGVPAVATAVDGVTDVVPSDAALLVRAGDSVAVAEAIQRIVDDGALASRLSAGARAASDRWSPDAMLAAYRELYAGLVRQR